MGSTGNGYDYMVRNIGDPGGADLLDIVSVAQSATKKESPNNLESLVMVMELTLRVYP